MNDRLDVRFAELVDATDDGNWAEVLDRANALRQARRPRPLLAIAAALAFAIVVAAPAVGLRGKIVRLFGEAQPAPQRIEKAFAGWNDQAPPGLGPGVQATLAIEVLETSAGRDGNVALWLAPARGGGFCTVLEVDGHGGGGGCDQVGYERLGVTVSLQGRVRPDGEILSGPVLLDGSTGDAKADSLLLRFEDGERATIPFVWVSAPVKAGFFVYAVPAPHWRAGHLPSSLALLAADGSELDRREIHGITTAGSLSDQESPR